MLRFASEQRQHKGHDPWSVGATRRGRAGRRTAPVETGNVKSGRASRTLSLQPPPLRLRLRYRRRLLVSSVFRKKKTTDRFFLPLYLYRRQIGSSLGLSDWTSAFLHFVIPRGCLRTYQLQSASVACSERFSSFIRSATMTRRWWRLSRQLSSIFPSLVILEKLCVPEEHIGNSSTVWSWRERERRRSFGSCVFRREANYSRARFFDPLVPFDSRIKRNRAPWKSRQRRWILRRRVGYRRFSYWPVMFTIDRIEDSSGSSNPWEAAPGATN